jgi:hypothetical protein
MSSEKYANLAETTLAADYTAGDSSISVSSASGFPTDGVFTVRLDNAAKTILRVSAVSGTTFTVTAEEFDGNASSGDAVILVASKATAERWLQAPETGEVRSPSGVDGGDFYGPFMAKLVALSQSSWSWVNQGSFSYSESAGFVYITGSAAAGTNIRGRFKTLPSLPFTVEVGVIHNFFQAAGVANLMILGPALRESGTSKISVFVLSNFTFSTGGAQPTIAAGDYTNATTFSAIVGSERSLPSMPQIAWLRIAVDSSNITYSFSFDGVNYFQVAQVSRTSFLAGGPDQLGWIATDQGGGNDYAGTIVHWREF